ncbi:MAG: metal-sensing transcriptional repressor [Lachnospiraceae bacterium]|nr:metal-sensing transcriptional repressor [Lachnospiraceae bacterium]
MSETHTHTDEFGNVYTHSHEDGSGETHAHSHSHTHTHDPKAMRAIVNRLSRSIGHMESVKRMIENGQDCADVLVQLAAVRSEINNAGKALLKEHLDHCIVEAVAENDQESIEKMNAAIDKFMK